MQLHFPLSPCRELKHTKAIQSHPNASEKYRSAAYEGVYEDVHRCLHIDFSLFIIHLAGVGRGTYRERYIWVQN